MNSNKSILIIGLVVYILSSAVSYAYFSNTKKEEIKANPTSQADSSSDEFAGQPLTDACPLNGKLYPKSQKEKWEKRRPMGIMVQNHTEARPQSGLSSADVLYEAVAEGGITRFLAMFYCENPKIVGSVRSARVYYMDLLQEYGNYPLYVHVGGANCNKTTGSGCANGAPADALGKIRKLGWDAYNDLEYSGVGYPSFRRDENRLPNRATEHTVYVDTNKLWTFAAEKRDLTNVDEDGVKWDEDFVPWTFQDDAKEANRGNVNAISFGFWDQFGSDYGVVWKYDRANNVYKRENGGEPHIDLNTKKQLTGKNIIVIFADESVANDGYDAGQHLLYDVIGTGDALIFQNGDVIKGSWNKKDATDRMTFTDEDGKDVELVRGKIWVEILPTGNKVNYGAALTETPKSTGTSKSTTTEAE